jgi:oxalate decarboxylase/phosphoglucose isomerase-like protein (cupin superfamily)
VSATLAYRRIVAEILEEGTFDVAVYADELAAAPGNLDVGTALLFENDRVKVWEVHLPSGSRGPFHAHTRPYFWTCVDPGVGRQRAPDGTLKIRRYERGDTMFSDHAPDDAMLHDLENVGEAPLRFITVELLA